MINDAPPPPGLPLVKRKTADRGRPRALARLCLASLPGSAERAGQNRLGCCHG
jgi:hypothetical protein